MSASPKLKRGRVAISSRLRGALRALYAGSGLGYREIGKLIGASPDAVNDWHNEGRTIGLDHLTALATAYKSLPETQGMAESLSILTQATGSSVAPPQSTAPTPGASDGQRLQELAKELSQIGDRLVATERLVAAALAEAQTRQRAEERRREGGSQ